VGKWFSIDIAIKLGLVFFAILGFFFKSSIVFLEISLAILSLELVRQSFLNLEKSFFLFFFTLFLILGTTLKYFLNRLIGVNFIEAVGDFTFQPEAWREVLLCLFAGLISLLLVHHLVKNKSLQFNLPNSSPIKISKKFNFKLNTLFVALFVFAVIISLINYVYGIHRVGLTPDTIWPWPANALIAFAVNIGLCIGFFLLLDMDLKVKSRLSIKYLIVTVICLGIISFSTLSRSILLFQIAPALMVILYSHRIEILKVKYSILPLCFVGLLILSIMVTSQQRRDMYLGGESNNSSINQKILGRIEILEGGINQLETLVASGQGDLLYLEQLKNEKKILEDKIKNSFDEKRNVENLSIKFRLSKINLSYEEFIKTLETMLQLTLSRFVGIEGIMSVQSFDGKSYSLFLTALKEKRSLDKDTIYQFVAKSNYRFTDKNMWQYATMPGLIAFLYMSGALAIVFIGVLIFSGLLFFYEQLIRIISGGAMFTTSMISCYYATSLAQIGLAPRSLIIYLILIPICIYLGKKTIERYAIIEM